MSALLAGRGIEAKLKYLQWSLVTASLPDHLSFFFFKGPGAHRDLPSSPTRRSSDLVAIRSATRSTIGFRPTLPPRRGDPGAMADFPGVSKTRPRHPPSSDYYSNVASRVGVSAAGDRKSTRLNSSHSQISYAVFCLQK